MIRRIHAAVPFPSTQHAVRLRRLVIFLLCPAIALHAQSVPPAPATHEEISQARFEVFPVGLLFPSLIASLKEPQLRNSLLSAHSTRDLNTLVGLTEQGRASPSGA